jgi:toxin-antitoxin system PIN domain toxin
VLLPDVNVLIYAHRAETHDHAAYSRWLVQLATGDAPFACSELALSGFLRIVTNPRIFREPTPVKTAMAFTRELLGCERCVRVRPGPGHWEIFERLCHETGASGPLIADAYHAALAIEHGCELVTTDGDFARFPGLRWSHPLKAPGGGGRRRQ